MNQNQNQPLLLIYGSRGWIGTQFIKLCKEKQINYILGQSRVENIDAVRQEVELNKPTHISTVSCRTRLYLKHSSKMINLLLPPSVQSLKGNHTLIITRLGCHTADCPIQ